ncbi:MAG: C4-dicarboxylate transporter DctA [Alphaproteobacteria bacterium]|nr:C4-dicarboxylate transporter DctA [Alphaproteobacteria bacterium]
MRSFVRFFGQLHIQVLLAIVIGGLIGAFDPKLGVALQPLADGFIKLIKMLLAPIIFGTVVTGIAKLGSIKEVGRIGLKALVYFEVLSTLALIIGLIAVDWIKPGAGMNIVPASLDATALSGYTAAAKSHGVLQFFMDIIPTTMVDAFAKGAMLQIILLSILFGIAIVQLGKRATPLVDILDIFLQGLFKIVGMIMLLAPIAAGAGVAFTIGKYGISSLWSLGELVGVMYGVAAIFIVLVLGSVLRLVGFSLFVFMRYIREEILIVLATCSTEAVLPAMMEKLEKLGCEKSVVGMVLPAGYTFNADGTCIYLTAAAIFVAQATNTHLTLTDQLVVLGVLLLTSKGSAGVAGAGFVTLAATLSTMNAIPVVGLALLLGVDRILNEARALTNLIGNGVATIVIAGWENALDRDRARAILAGGRVGRNPYGDNPERHGLGQGTERVTIGFGPSRGQ